MNAAYSDQDGRTLALLQGDPAGIGPELLAKLLSQEDVRSTARIVVIGDPRIFARGEQQAGLNVEGVRHVPPDVPVEFRGDEILHIDLAIDGIDAVPLGTASREGGDSSLQALHRSLELARDGIAQGIVFMPFNKQSMHLAGNPYADEMGYARAFFGIETPVSEFNVANGMWNGRVTSHVAMSEVPALLTVERISRSILLAHATLRSAGYEYPRIVVAAYNPHAGDGGLMGDEEERVIRPAIEIARKSQVNCFGPLPADTVWLKVRDGEFDAVVTMYHDQGQIAIKLLGFERGVSVLAGLPVPITTPAHGTAYDIAGTNAANLVPTHNAFTMCLNMASNRHATEGVAVAGRIE